ncbi:hypothetical protein BSIN_4889 [Burkholderia singularis]|uniref:Uncharacterized protein n=1 Tax=Burkholderia singularis TaxID=1503053 RepID=A0A238H9X2_9BURK|nr:hypothetical protein BSIN_4889 [Burkholderia singularis]
MFLPHAEKNGISNFPHPKSALFIEIPDTQSYLDDISAQVI